MAKISHYPPNLLTLTWTKVETLRFCPLRFFFKFVEMLPEIVRFEMERGGHFHAWMEDLGELIMAGEPLDKDTAYKALLKRAALLDEEAAADLRDIVARMLERGLPSFPSDAADLGFEVPFAIDSSGKETDWDNPNALIRSVWDQVFRENQGRKVVVRDWKTNRVIKQDTAQMRLYRWAALCKYPEATESVTELHFVRFNVVKRPLEKDLEPDALREQVPVELLAVQEEIARRLRDNQWEPRISSSCMHCSWRSRCPAMTASDRPPVEIIGSAEEAAAAANELVQLKARVADLETKLDSYAEWHGDIDLGAGEVYGAVVKEREEVVDIRAAARILREYDVPEVLVWESLKFPKAKLNKCITAAIRTAPRGTKAEARRAVEEAIWLAGAMKLTHHTEMKRHELNVTEITDEAE